MKPLHTLTKSSSNQITFLTTQDPNSEVFHREGQGLYAWVYKNEYETGTGRPKGGQYGTNAQNGMTPQETIRSYTGVTKDAIVILWSIRLTDEQIKEHGSAYNVEQKAFKGLPKSKFGSSTEVYDVDLDIIKERVNKVLHPQVVNSLTKKTYQPRLRQEEAIKKFENYVNTNIFQLRNGTIKSIDFLLGAVMRFGKNFTFLQMSKRVIPSNGNILVLTNRPDVFDSLSDDISTHIDFDDWIYDELKERKYDWKPSSDSVNVLTVSTQLLTHKQHRKKLVNYLKQFHWDIRVIDEADTGILTKLGMNLLNELISDITVWMSGTPWKVISHGKFNNQNSFIYDYLDQQEDRRKGIDFSSVPLDFYCMEVLDTIKNQQKWYTDDESFTLTKLFSFNEETNNFIHQTDVRLFLESVLGYIPKTSFSPYKIIDTLQHTIWILPSSVKAVLKMKEMIEDITDGEYKVFAATSNETKDISDIKDFLEFNNDIKTITLTINRFTRGTTVGEWNGTLFLSDTDSAEHYFQSAFRPTSPLFGKEKGYVFDFNPNRSLSMLAEYSHHSSVQRGETDPKKMITRFLDNINIFGLDGGVTFVKKSIESVLNDIRDFGNNSIILKKSARNYTNIFNISDELLKSILELDKEKTKRKTTITNSDILKKGKNKETLNKTEKRQLRNVENDIYSRIGTLFSRCSLFCEIGYTSIEQVLQSVDDDIFYEYINTTKSVVSRMIEEEVIDVYQINLQMTV